MADISPAVQNHLVNVYSLLAATSGAAALGSYLDFHLYLGGFNGIVTSLVGLLLFMAVLNLSPTKDNYQTRVGCLLGFGLCQGISISPLITYSFLLSGTSSLVLQALTSTALIFGCFTVGALVSRRRSYLYLGGLLSSAMTVLFWMSFANLFVRSSAMFNAELYLGLLAFAGFVVYDTQLVIEKASAGDRDHVLHSAELFMDVFGLFARILVLLLKKEQNEQEKKRRRRKD